MERIEKLKALISDLYEEKKPGRAELADWMFTNHIFIVADNARELSARYGEKNYLAEVSAMLHDIADTEMLRENPDHEERSLEIARELLHKCNFSESEVEIIVEDAARNHGCHGGNKPKTAAGKIMATADAVAHLNTDFYYFLEEVFKKEKRDSEVNEWALRKIERDMNAKIFFEDVREEMMPYYEKLRTHFGGK